MMTVTLPSRNSSPAPIIRVEDIHKRFGGVHALRGVSLEVGRGEILGLIGHNGAGKTTLIRILTGDLKADEGQLYIDGIKRHFSSAHDAMAQGIGAVRQELDLVPELSIAENLFLGAETPFQRGGFLDRRAMGEAARALIDRVGLDYNPRTPLRALSIGDQQLIAAARALRSAGRVMLLDEPTSSLTPWEAERLFEQVQSMASSGIAIIYISHRLEEVTSLCHRVTILREGIIVGDFADPVSSQREIVNTLAPVIDAASSTPLHLENNAQRGEVLLEARELRIGKHGPASFTVHAGEIVGLFGLIGAGRTTVARALVGDLPLDAGELRLRGAPLMPESPWHGYRQGIAYLSENRKSESIFTGRTVSTNILLRAPQQIAPRGWLNFRRAAAVTDATIQRLGIRPAQPLRLIETLSGGNQQKAVLGRLLADDLDVLVLDEPTHGIDIAAKRDLLHLLRELAAQGKGILFISSELPELMTVADRVLVMRRGKVVGEFMPAAVTERDIVGAAVGEATHKARIR